MANRDTPCGFRVAHGVGSEPKMVRIYIDSSNSTNVFVGDMMDLNAAGSVRPAAADAGVSAAGVCVALYDSNGVPIGSPGSSVTTKYLPLSTAGYALVALAIPGVVFIGQLDTGTARTIADIGATCDHVAGTGSTTTGLSAHELDSSDVGTGLQTRILGLVDEPGNSWAEHAKVYFVFNESAFGCSAAATV